MTWGNETTAFWPDISRDILKILDTLDVSGPIVGIGHSFGGGALYVTSSLVLNNLAKSSVTYRYL